MTEETKWLDPRDHWHKAKTFWLAGYTRTPSLLDRAKRPELVAAWQDITAFVDALDKALCTTTATDVIVRPPTGRMSLAMLEQMALRATPAFLAFHLTVERKKAPTICVVAPGLETCRLAFAMLLAYSKAPGFPVKVDADCDNLCMSSANLSIRFGVTSKLQKQPRNNVTIFLSTASS